MPRLTDMLKGLVPHTQADPTGLSNTEIAELLQTSPESLAAMSKWLPSLERAVASTGFFRVPETTVRSVPLPILQLTRLDYSELTCATMEVVDGWARDVFELDSRKDYFIKTGTFSSKFDFRNTHPSSLPHFPSQRKRHHARPVPAPRSPRLRQVLPHRAP